MPRPVDNWMGKNKAQFGTGPWPASMLPTHDSKFLVRRWRFCFDAIWQDKPLYRSRKTALGLPPKKFNNY